MRYWGLWSLSRLGGERECEAPPTWRWVSGSSPHIARLDSAGSRSQTWGHDRDRELQEGPPSSGSGRERRETGRREIGRGGSVCCFGAPGQSYLHPGCSQGIRVHRHLFREKTLLSSQRRRGPRGWDPVASSRRGEPGPSLFPKMQAQWGGVCRRAGWLKPPTSARGLERGAPGSPKVTEACRGRGSRRQPAKLFMTFGLNPKPRVPGSSPKCHPESKDWTTGRSTARVPHWPLGSAHTGRIQITLQRLWKQNWHWNHYPQKAIWNFLPEPNWVDCMLKQKYHHSQ